MADWTFVVVEFVELVVGSRSEQEVVLGVETDVVVGSASFGGVFFVWIADRVEVDLAFDLVEQVVDLVVDLVVDMVIDLVVDLAFDLVNRVGGGLMIGLVEVDFEAFGCVGTDLVVEVGLVEVDRVEVDLVFVPVGEGHGEVDVLVPGEEGELVEQEEGRAEVEFDVVLGLILVAIVGCR